MQKKKKKKELTSRIEQPKSASQSNTVRVVDLHTLEKQAKRKRYLKEVSSLLYQKTVSGLNIACSAIKTWSADRGTSLTWTMHREEEHQQLFTQVWFLADRNRNYYHSAPVWGTTRNQNRSGESVYNSNIWSGPKLGAQEKNPIGKNDPSGATACKWIWASELILCLNQDVNDSSILSPMPQSKRTRVR